jgi:hypothetical protein
VYYSNQGKQVYLPEHLPFFLVQTLMETNSFTINPTQLLGRQRSGGSQFKTSQGKKLV